ncbi:MAG TPA: hypothetical protein VF916_03325, partial [Ktedonobacterales bacterium]
VTEHLQQLVDEADVSLRMGPKALEAALDDEQITALSEERLGNRSLNYLGQRHAYEEQTWEYPRGAPEIVRPVSGYITPHGLDDPGVAGYGDVRVILRDDVRPRTTLTFGDSLDNYRGVHPGAGLSVPRSLEDVRADSFTWLSPERFVPEVAIDPLDLKSLADYYDRPANIINDYVEAQIHGGVALGDIREVVFTEGMTPSQELTDALDAKGVKWRIEGQTAQREAFSALPGDALSQRVVDTLGQDTASDWADALGEHGQLHGPIAEREEVLAWTPRETSAEVSDALREQLGTVHVNVDEFDPAIANQFAQTLQALGADWPEVFDEQVQYIGQTGRDFSAFNPTSTLGRTRYSLASSDGPTIGFNRYFFSAARMDAADLVTTLQEHVEEKWFFDGAGSPASQLAHEFGHSLYDWGLAQERPEVTRLFFDYMNRWSEEVPTFSRYAATDPHEFFAEAFSAQYFGTPEVLADPMVADMGRLLDDLRQVLAEVPGAEAAGAGVDEEAVASLRDIAARDQERFIARPGEPPIGRDQANFISATLDAGDLDARAVARALKDDPDFDAFVKLWAQKREVELGPRSLVEMIQDHIWDQRLMSPSPLGVALHEAFNAEFGISEVLPYSARMIAEAQTTWGGAEAGLRAFWREAAQSILGAPERVAIGDAGGVLARAGDAVRYVDDEAARAAASVFGPDVTGSDLAGVVGAQPSDVVNVEALDNGQVSVSVQGDHYQSVFQFTRTPEGIVADGDVQVDAGYRSVRSGRAVLESMDNMRDAGVVRLDVIASREGADNGYYTWARLGFKGDIPQSVLGDARAQFGQDITTVEDLMARPGGPAWWREHGVTWEASYDFPPRPIGNERFAQLGERFSALSPRDLPQLQQALADAQAEMDKAAQAYQDHLDAWNTSPDRAAFEQTRVSLQGERDRAAQAMRDYVQTHGRDVTDVSRALRSEWDRTIAQLQDFVAQGEHPASTGLGRDLLQEFQQRAYDVDRAQADISSAQGGRGVTVHFGQNELHNPAAEQQVFDMASRQAFGRVLTRDEIAGMIGAPEDSFIEVAASPPFGDNVTISYQLYGPSWEPGTVLAESHGIPTDIEYHAERYLTYDARTGQMTMENSFFAIRSDLQGSGIGRQVFLDEVDQLTQMGVRKIVTEGAGDAVQFADWNGYYTWPRFGYNGLIPQDPLDVLRNMAADGR